MSAATLLDFLVLGIKAKIVCMAEPVGTVEIGTGYVESAFSDGLVLAGFAGCDCGWLCELGAEGIDVDRDGLVHALTHFAADHHCP